MSGMNGALSVLGNSDDSLTLDDSGSSADKVIAVTAKRVTGLSPAPINFNNLAALAILLGSGNDAVTIQDTSSGATQINTGGGNDAVTIAATSNPLTVSTGSGPSNWVLIATPDNIAGPVHVDGTLGGDALTVDASAQTAGRTVTLTSTALTGLTPAPVTFAGADLLNVVLGSGNDQIRVNSVPAAGVTNINTGAGADAVTLAPTQPLAGALNLYGASGSNTLELDATGLTGNVNLVLGDTSIANIGADVSYVDFASLSVAFGAGSNSLHADGNFPRPVAVASAGPLAANLHFTGDFAGHFILPATSTSTVVFDGSLEGTLSSAGTLTSVIVGRHLAGSLSAAMIRTLSILGNDSGSITAGDIHTVYLPNAAPNAAGVVFSARQAGALRSVQALAANGSTLANVRFAVAYDGSGKSPSAAIRVSNPAPAANRFDLVLETNFAGEPFNLTRLEAAPGKAAGVRNVVVSGSLLANTTASQRALLGNPAGGTVFLPKDRLAAVSVRHNLPARSVRAASIQALSFHTHTDATGRTRTADQLAADDKRWAGILASTLVINPKTKKPYAKVVRPAETLRIIASNHPQGLFIGKMTSNKGSVASLFDDHVTYISDKTNIGTPVMADILFAKKPKADRPVINSVAFTGDGGSIKTTCFVDKISSTGPLGDVSIDAGTQQILRKINAPSIAGKVRLFGGKLISAKK